MTTSTLSYDQETGMLDDRQRRERAQKYLDSLKESSLGKRLELVQPALKKNHLSASSEEESDDNDDDGDDDKITIKTRLQQDITMSKGKVFQNIASSFIKRLPSSNSNEIKYLHKGNNQNMIPTSSSFSKCGKWVWSAYKSGSLIKWNIETSTASLILEKPSKPSGHLLCLAISPDDKYILTGCSKGHITLRSTLNGKILEKIEGKHRASITGMKFIIPSSSDSIAPTLFTSSLDRTVKIWNICKDDVVMDQEAANDSTNDIDEKVTLLYVDTLFGHQDGILAIDCLTGERCVTVGARDRTARFWKVPEESQLIFRANEAGSGGGGSLDTVAMIDNEHFITGSDSGQLSLFALHKKKSLCSKETISTTKSTYSPITALHSVLLTDLIISATQDGSGDIVFWKISEDFKELEEIGRLNIDSGSSLINSISLNEDQNCIVLSLSKEPKMGRWNVVGKNGRNRIVIIPLLNV